MYFHRVSHRRYTALLLLLVALLFVNSDAEPKDTTPDNPIVIAIVDDGLVYDLDVFSGMLWKNPAEIPNNGRDDDGNSRIDDLMGWDVSDKDEDVRPPELRLAEYPHGTYMSALIARTIRQHLGDMDDYPIKLMFIKAISDTAKYLNMQDGYAGLQVAIDQRADVVNLSWSGGILDNAALETLNEARLHDVFVVGAVGTYAQKVPAYPAQHPAVFGVAGVDKAHRLYKSNYGEEVDIAALSDVATVRLLGDDSPDEIAGVSNSAALVSATVALMKFANPAISNREIKNCLQSTALAIDDVNIDIAGQLGAGELDTEAAIACVKKAQETSLQRVKNPKGTLSYAQERSSRVKVREWLIAPVGMYEGLVFKPFVEGEPKKTRLSVIAVAESDIDAVSSSGSSSGRYGELIWSGLLSEMPTTIDTEHSAVKIRLDIKSNKAFEFQTHFVTQNIDQSVRFCSELVEVVVDQVDQPVVISDGSGEEFYAINSDCKWYLSPKAGYDLVLDFTQLDTELNVDSLYLFRGNTTSQSELLMKMSGAKLPPKIIIENRSALLWFVSNDKNQRPGFEVQVSLKRSKQKNIDN